MASVGCDTCLWVMDTGSTRLEGRDWFAHQGMFSVTSGLQRWGLMFCLGEEIRILWFPGLATQLAFG